MKNICKMNNFWAFSGSVGLLAYFLIPINMSFVWKFVSFASAVVIGSVLGIYYVLSKGQPYSTCPQPKQIGNLMKLLMERTNQEPIRVRKQSVVISRSVDASIDELLTLIIRDYVMYFLKDITHDHEKLQELIKDDYWIVVKNIKDVLGKFDEVKFLTSDVTNKLCQHYQKIRISSLGDSREQKPIFYLRPYLQTQETELEFLRKVSEAFLVLLLPPSYSRCEPIRHLLREILSCSVLYPTIKMLCDPDYINQQLLNYILYHQEMMEHHKKTYAYAATYEDFIKMISVSTDVNHLKQMRYKIMSEIMQATTINNLKKAKGMDVDKEFNPLSGHKGDLLQARNLERYINQLTIAKNRCEQKMKTLGGPDYLSPSSPTTEIHEELSPNIPGRKVLSYQVIMEIPYARQYFMKFLEKENAHSFLSFWEFVETMKQEDKKNLHNIGNDVYKKYVANASSPIKLEKNIVKGMEMFLIGDKGPEAFFNAQDIVSRLLEERHYPCFIVSNWYHKMLKGADEQGIDFMTASSEHAEDGNGISNETSVDSGPMSNILLSDHSSFAREKMQQLEERLNNKTQAYQALKSSQNSDAKVISKLQKTIEAIKDEKNRLESHINRTELWSENLGKWKINVASAKVIYDKDKPCPSFNLDIHLKDRDMCSSSDENVSGWSVAKKLSDFMVLHHKLIQIGPWLKYTELPKGGKTLFKNYDKPFLEKAKHLLQAYMNLVMEDDKVSRSECLYTFLSPTSEFFLQPPPSSKKSKSFLTSFFKGNQNTGQQEGSDEDEFLFWDDDSGPMKDDPIAEPLYALISEIFDMRGVFKLLRRTIMTFVQITYGRTINRQLRETVSWMFSEGMIIYYLNLFRDAMWPNGVLAKPSPVRSEEEKAQTRSKARIQFLNSIPEVLSNLVGQLSAKRGALKVFESLQDERFNKQIFYELFELFLNEIFTENRLK